MVEQLRKHLTAYQKVYLSNMLEYLRSVLDPAAAYCAADQIANAYGHWSPFPDTTIADNGEMKGKSGKMKPLARYDFRDGDAIFIFDYSIIAAKNIDGRYDVVRID